MGWMTGVRFPTGPMINLFFIATASIPVLGPTQPPIQWVPGALTSGVNRPGCEVDHSTPSNAEVNAWSYTSTPPVLLHVVVLNEAKYMS
jgi:hypothetical protein